MYVLVQMHTDLFVAKLSTLLLQMHGNSFQRKLAILKNGVTPTPDVSKNLGFCCIQMMDEAVSFCVFFGFELQLSYLINEVIFSILIPIFNYN